MTTDEYGGPIVIEDEDGAPLPPALQRGSRLHEAAVAWVGSLTSRDTEEWPKRTTDDLMVVLAPMWADRDLEGSGITFTTTAVHVDGELVDPAGKILLIHGSLDGVEHEALLQGVRGAGISLVIALADGQTVETLDEGEMAAAGWVRDPARNVPEPRLPCPGCAGLGWLPAGVS